jgi:hypothetical protein
MGHNNGDARSNYPGMVPDDSHMPDLYTGDVSYRIVRAGFQISYSEAKLYQARSGHGLSSRLEPL